MSVPLVPLALVPPKEDEHGAETAVAVQKAKKCILQGAFLVRQVRSAKDCQGMADVIYVIDVSCFRCFSVVRSESVQAVATKQRTLVHCNLAKRSKQGVSERMGCSILRPFCVEYDQKSADLV